MLTRTQTAQGLLQEASRAVGQEIFAACKEEDLSAKAEIGCEIDTAQEGSVLCSRECSRAGAGCPGSSAKPAVGTARKECHHCLLGWHC